MFFSLKVVVVERCVCCLPPLIDVACRFQSVLTVSLSNERTSICLGTAHTFRQRTRVDDDILLTVDTFVSSERENHRKSTVPGTVEVRR